MLLSWRAARRITATAFGSSPCACQAGTAIGAGIVVTPITFQWFTGFVVLSLVLFMTRPKA